MPPTPTKPQPATSPKDDVASILGDMGLTSNQMSVVTNRPGATAPPGAIDAASPDPLADLAESADALLRQMVDPSPKNGTAHQSPASPQPSSSPPPNIEALDEHLADAVDSMLAIEREPSLPPPDPQASNAPPPQKFEAIAPGPVKEIEPPSNDPPPIAPKPAAPVTAVEPTKPIEPAAPVAVAPPPPPPPPPSMVGATATKPNPAPSITPAPAAPAKPPAHTAAIQTAKGLTGATAKHGQSLLKAVEPPLLKAAAAISKPLSSKPKLVRDIVAGAALITLFWAGCVWLYVLALQPPAGPSAPKAHEETADAGGAGGHGEAKKDDGHGAKKDDGHGAKKTEKKKPSKKDSKKDAKASGGH